FFFTYILLSVIYTLSLHDALPISNYKIIMLNCQYLIYKKTEVLKTPVSFNIFFPAYLRPSLCIVCFLQKLQNLDISNFATSAKRDRKSTRLNSSHVKISYAVFCLK